MADSVSSARRSEIMSHIKSIAYPLRGGGNHE